MGVPASRRAGMWLPASTRVLGSYPQSPARTQHLPSFRVRSSHLQTQAPRQLPANGPPAPAQGQLLPPQGAPTLPGRSPVAATGSGARGCTCFRQGGAAQSGHPCEWVHGDTHPVAWALIGWRSGPPGNCRRKTAPRSCRINKPFTGWSQGHTQLLISSFQGPGQ